MIPLKKPRSARRTSFLNGGSKFGLGIADLKGVSRPNDSCVPANSSVAGPFLGMDPKVPVGTTRGWIPRKGTSKPTTPKIRCFARPACSRRATSAARIPPRLCPSKMTSRSSASCGESLWLWSVSRFIIHNFPRKHSNAPSVNHIPGAELVHCGLDFTLGLVSRVYAGIHHVRLGQRSCQQIVNMGREIVEASF